MTNKREKIALGLFVFGFVWWIAENFYFGWNQKPQSALEGAADFIVWVFWGLAFFIRPTRIEITQYKVEKGTFNLLGETTLNNNRATPEEQL